MTTMASPQWKNYQAPVPDPAILAFQRSSPQMTANMLASRQHAVAAAAAAAASNPIIQAAAASVVSPSSLGVSPPTGTNMSLNGGAPVRETGIIEKLLHSYGFVQCCDRDARLFFHFSEYNGNVDTMKIGDSVEFMMSYDRRTGKPVATAVVRLEGGTASFEVMSESPVTGTVCAEAKAAKPSKNSGNCVETLIEVTGMVSYEQVGEHFFLSYGPDDVEDGMELHNGDEITFFIATDKRNGNIRARKIKLTKSAKPERYQGVVCSMKDNYGFIERADAVKEIFFHYSEFSGDIDGLHLGDDVQFSIQSRNGKDVATGVEKLPEGTVIFEDVAIEMRRGKIEKTLKAPHGRRQSDPLAGRIVYETVKGAIEIPYGDKDQKGDYTLQPGDLVQFNIATDRRDKLQRATNITLVCDTFKVNGEKREKGVIVTLKEGFGFIRCADREARMFFHFSELMEPDAEPKIQEEVEFTVIQDPTAASRQIAIRIRPLPRGSVKFESVLAEKHPGTVEKEAAQKAVGKNKDPDPGIIMYDVNGTKQTIPFSAKTVQGQPPKVGDKIEFQICESRKNNTKTAVNVVLKFPGRQDGKTQDAERHYGFIATLKDNFGFIELSDHEKEVFFHFSAFDGEANDLDLGDEVEFTLSRKTAKVSAEKIRKIPKGTVAPEEVQPGCHDGKVLRCMRILNPGQEEYPGIVQVGTEDNGGKFETYPYGITSLADKRDFLQKGDVVSFQIAIVEGTGKRRATNIIAKRKVVRARVDSIKGQYGFLNYEVEDGKKLFFHMTEVHDNAELSSGDEVEFVVVQNQRNSKYSAVSLRKLTGQKRPERLISRLKSVGDECGPRLIAIRPPRGPDGTKGFSRPRMPWMAP